VTLHYAGKKKKGSRTRTSGATYSEKKKGKEGEKKKKKTKRKRGPMLGVPKGTTVQRMNVAREERKKV